MPLETNVKIGEELGKAFSDAISAALTQYGAGTVLLVLGIVALFIVHEKLWRRVLNDKNGEIKRLTEERNRYQDIFLKERLSSTSLQKRNKLRPPGEKQ